MLYSIKIKSNLNEYSLESTDKEIIQREMDLYFASFFDVSDEFKEKIVKIEVKRCETNDKSSSSLNFNKQEPYSIDTLESGSMSLNINANSASNDKQGNTSLNPIINDFDNSILKTNANAYDIQKNNISTQKHSEINVQNLGFDINKVNSTNIQNNNLLFKNTTPGNTQNNTHSTLNSQIQKEFQNIEITNTQKPQELQTENTNSLNNFESNSNMFVNNAEINKILNKYSVNVPLQKLEPAIPKQLGNSQLNNYTNTPLEKFEEKNNTAILNQPTNAVQEPIIQKYENNDSTVANSIQNMQNEFSNNSYIAESNSNINPVYNTANVENKTEYETQINNNIPLQQNTLEQSSNNIQNTINFNVDNNTINDIKVDIPDIKPTNETVATGEINFSKDNGFKSELPDNFVSPDPQTEVFQDINVKDVSNIAQQVIEENNNGIPQEKTVTQSNLNPEMQNILNLMKNSIGQTDIKNEHGSENLMDMFSGTPSEDMSARNSFSDIKADEDISNTYHESDGKSYEKNQAIINDIFMTNQEPEVSQNIQNEIQTDSSIQVQNPNDSEIINIRDYNSESDNNQNYDLEINTQNPNTEQTQTQVENQPEILPDEEVHEEKALLDFKLFRAGFIINDISDDFLVCAYYIKNILRNQGFTMKFINSKLFSATGQFADMSVVDELITKGYIKEFEIDSSKQFSITQDGEMYFVAKFQS